MNGTVRALASRKRVWGRVISGGSRLNNDDKGLVLINEIKRGFFEGEGRRIYIPYDAFSSLSAVSLN